MRCSKCKTPYWQTEHLGAGKAERVVMRGAITACVPPIAAPGELVSRVTLVEHHPQCKCGICVAADPKKQPSAAPKKKWGKGAK